ncbi:hypothetical protein [Soonwooa sp.]
MLGFILKRHCSKSPFQIIQLRKTRRFGQITILNNRIRQSGIFPL